MEEKMKNLFEYLKEIYELKTRVILDYKKFDLEIDIEDFKNIYEKRRRASYRGFKRQAGIY